MAPQPATRKALLPLEFSGESSHQRTERPAAFVVIVAALFVIHASPLQVRPVVPANLADQSVLEADAVEHAAGRKQTQPRGAPVCQ